MPKMEKKGEGNDGNSANSGAKMYTCIFCLQSNHKVDRKIMFPATSQFVEKWLMFEKSNQDSNLRLKLEFQKSNNLDTFYHKNCLSRQYRKMNKIERHKKKEPFVKLEQDAFNAFINGLKERFAAMKGHVFQLSDLKKEYKDIRKQFNINEKKTSGVHCTRLKNSILNVFQDMTTYNMGNRTYMVNGECKGFVADNQRKCAPSSNLPQQEIMFCDKCNCTDLNLCFICQELVAWKTTVHSKRRHAPSKKRKERFWNNAKRSEHLRCDQLISPKYVEYTLFYRRLMKYSYEEFMELEYVRHKHCTLDFGKETEEKLIKRKQKLVETAAETILITTNQTEPFASQTELLASKSSDILSAKHNLDHEILEDDFDGLADLEVASSDNHVSPTINLEKECQGQESDPSHSEGHNQQISPNKATGENSFSVKFRSYMNQMFQKLCRGDLNFDTSVRFTGHIIVNVDTNEPMQYVIDETINAGTIPGNQYDDWTGFEDETDEAIDIDDQITVEKESKFECFNFSYSSEIEQEKVIKSPTISCDENHEDKECSTLKSNGQKKVTDKEHSSTMSTEKIEAPSEILKKESFCSRCKQSMTSYNRGKLPIDITRYKLECGLCGKVYKTSKEKQACCQIFSCTMCNRKYTRKDRLVDHMRLYNKTREETHKYMCDICKRRFTNKDLLLAHTFTHDSHGGLKPFQCTLCSSAFATKRYLYLHIKNIHEADKNAHICDQCGKGFTRRCHLLSHRNSQHELRQFKCHTCGDIFRSKTSLNRHKHRHSLKKPHNCFICEKGFIQKRQLKTHMSVHHGQQYC